MMNVPLQFGFCEVHESVVFTREVATRISQPSQQVVQPWSLQSKQPFELATARNLVIRKADLGA